MANTTDRDRLWETKRDYSLSALQCIWNRNDTRRCVKITGQDLLWLLGLVYELSVQISTREQSTNPHVVKNSFSNRQRDGIHFNSLSIRHTQSVCQSSITTANIHKLPNSTKCYFKHIWRVLQSDTSGHCSWQTCTLAALHTWKMWDRQSRLSHLNSYVPHENSARICVIPIKTSLANQQDRQCTYNVTKRYVTITKEMHNFVINLFLLNHPLHRIISSTNFNAQFSLFINNMSVTLLSSTCFEH